MGSGEWAFRPGGYFRCCLFVFLVVLVYLFLSLFYSYIFALTSRVMARRVASAATRGKFLSERYSGDAFSILLFRFYCFPLFFYAEGWMGMMILIL